jgi:hypothetical protein
MRIKGQTSMIRSIIKLFLHLGVYPDQSVLLKKFSQASKILTCVACTTYYQYLLPTLLLTLRVGQAIRRLAVAVHCAYMDDFPDEEEIPFFLGLAMQELQVWSYVLPISLLAKYNAVPALSSSHILHSHATNHH